MENEDQTRNEKLTLREMINKKSQERGRKHPGSYSEMKKMIEETEARFVNPEPQSLLGENPGLTLTQMSESLEIPHAEMRRKFDKSGVKKYLSQCNYDVMEFSITSQDNKKVRSYVFSVEAAKHVAASVNSLKGFLYRDFLIRSTEALKVTIDHAEEQAKNIERSKEENDRLRRENIELKKLIEKKKDPYDPWCNLVVGSAQRDSILHGQSNVAETVQKKKSDLSESELVLHDIQTSIRRGLGYFNRAFKSFLKIDVGCKKEEKSFENCLQASNELDEIINKTSLDRDVILKSEKPLLKGRYIQPWLIEDETIQAQYLN